MSFSELIHKAKTFFRDESIPMTARVAVAGGIALVLSSPFWSSLTTKRKRVPGVISAVSFPQGGSGLADPTGNRDIARAKANELLKKQEKKVKTRIIQEKKFLEKLDPTSKTASVEPQEKVGAEKTKARDNKPFRALPIPIKVSRGIIQSPNGSIWLAHRHGIFLFQEGKLSKAKSVLSPHIYDADHNRDIPELSFIASDEENSLYAGFVNGQIMEYKRYEWKILPQKTEDKISSIVAKQQKIFFGSKGLYQYNKSLEQLFANPEHKKAWVRAFANSPSGETYMSSKRALWKHLEDENDSWKIVWVAPKSDIAIRKITIQNDKSILLGTHNGFVKISNKGVVIDRGLEGEDVHSIVENADGSKWIGTRGNGLRYFDGTRWYSATSKQGMSDWATELLLDTQGRLWVGATGVGVFIANEKKAAKWIKQFPDQTEIERKPLEFANACEAADSLIGDLALSNQIANRSFDGRGYVFMNGKQVCPIGVGLHNTDGTTAILKDWNLLILKDNKRSEVIIPKEIAADRALTIFLDSKNRFWLSTQNGGLFLFDKEEWETIENKELENNAIQSIVEDRDGRIWFGSTPKVDKEKQIYLQASLHSFQDGTWRHYDSKDGIAQNSTLSMMLSDKGKVAIGTRDGISILEKDKDYQVTNYNAVHGLPSKQITSVNLDPKERIWFSHSFFGEGFAWIQKDSIFRFTSAQGLPSNTIVNLALDRNGRVWVQASNGKLVAYPIEYLEEKSKEQKLNTQALRTFPLGDHRNTNLQTSDNNSSRIR